MVVGDRGRSLGFAGETGEAVGVGCEGVGEDLDGDVAIEFGVRRAVDGSHATFAEFGGEAVMGDGGLRGHLFKSAGQLTTTVIGRS